MNNMNLPSDVSAKTGLPTFIVAVGLMLAGCDIRSVACSGPGGSSSQTVVGIDQPEPTCGGPAQETLSYEVEAMNDATAAIWAPQVGNPAEASLRR